MTSQEAAYKRNMESSILFMQQEHAATLRALHEEIQKLQKKCSGIILNSNFYILYSTIFCYYVQIIISSYSLFHVRLTHIILNEYFPFAHHNTPCSSHAIETVCCLSPVLFFLNKVVEVEVVNLNIYV